jgi:hypothetical protein
MGIETYELIKTAFRDEDMSRTQVSKWLRSFKDGRKFVEDDERCGRPSSSSNDAVIAKVRDLMTADRRLALREVVVELGISFCSCQAPQSLPRMTF